MKLRGGKRLGAGRPWQKCPLCKEQLKERRWIFVVGTRTVRLCPRCVDHIVAVVRDA